MNAGIIIIILALSLLGGAIFLGVKLQQKLDAAKDAKISKEQRDIASKPAPMLDDIVDWLSQ